MAQDHASHKKFREHSKVAFTQAMNND